MMYNWTPDAIRFRADAAAFANFDAAIAEKILPRLTPGCRICDAGCGLGYASLALAEAGMNVTAIDRDEAALAHLRAEAEKRRLCLHIEQGDAYALRPETPFDAMLFSIFGQTQKLLSAAKEQCRGTLFLVRKNWSGHRFTGHSSTLPRRNAESCETELRALGIPFEKECFTLDMGQPFRCREDARHFARLFTGEEPTEQELNRRLQPTGREDFPLYWPAPGELVLFAVETTRIPGKELP